MFNHLKSIRDAVGTENIRAGGEAIGLAVAVTDDELVTARGGSVARRGVVQRLRLDTITKMSVLPNPHANLVEIEFAGRPPKSVTFLYDPRTAKDLDAVLRILRQRASSPTAISPVAAPDVPAAAVATATQGEDGTSAARRNRIILFFLLAPLIGLHFAQILLR